MNKKFLMHFSTFYVLSSVAILISSVQIFALADEKVDSGQNQRTVKSNEGLTYLKSEKSNLSKSSVVKEEDYKTLIENNESLAKNLKLMKDTIKNKETENKALKDSARNLKRKISNLKKDLSKETNRNEDVFDEMTDLEEKYETLQRSKNYLVSEVYEVRNENERVLEELSSYQLYSDELKQEIVECQSRLQKLYFNSQQLNRDNSVLGTKNLELQEMKDNVTTENLLLNQSISNNIETIKKLEDENAQFKRENVSFQHLLLKLINGESLSEFIKNVNNSKILMSSSKREILKNQLSNHLNDLKHDTASMSILLVEYSMKIAVLENETSSLLNDNVALRHENLRLNLLINELLSQNNEIHSEISIYKPQVSELQKEIFGLTNKLSETEASLNKLQIKNGAMAWKLQEENEKLKTEKHDLNKIIRSQQKEINVLKSQLNSSKTKSHDRNSSPQEKKKSN